MHVQRHTVVYLEGLLDSIQLTHVTDGKLRAHPTVIRYIHGYLMKPGPKSTSRGKDNEDIQVQRRTHHYLGSLASSVSKGLVGPCCEPAQPGPKPLKPRAAGRGTQNRLTPPTFFQVSNQMSPLPGGLLLK